ncbi:MAG: hypothetical protein ACLPP9_11210 [Smithella sp.]
MGLLKNAHLLCCAANRTTQRISIYASRFGFLRASHLNIFEQPPHMGYFNNPNGHGSDAFWQNVTKKANKQSFYLPQ